MKHSNLRNYTKVDWSGSRYGRCGPSHLLDGKQSEPGRYDADGNRSIVCRLAVSTARTDSSELIIANVKLCDDSKQRTEY